MSNQTGSIYETLSPWAEADPIPLKGLSARLTDLSGKKMGLLINNKRAAEPILTVAARRLKEKFPTIEFSWFKAESFSVSEFEAERRKEFEDWIQSVDAVIAAVGD
jgi:hypothetical protein